MVNKYNYESALFQEIEERYGFVGGSYEQFIRYFHRPLPKRMWHWDLACNARAVAGMSAVPKKDPQRQRKLLMQCAANFAWEDIRGHSRLGLFGGDAIARLHVTGDHWARAAFDENNAFTRVVTPRWMWAWVTAPAVLAGDVWDVIPLDLQRRCHRGTWVAAQYCRLAMGSSHSVHILMSINLTVIGRALESSRRLTESSCPTPGSKNFDNFEDDERGLVLSDAAWELRQTTRRSRVQGESGLTLLAWLEEARAAKRAEQRIIVVLLLFSGARRQGDPGDFLDKHGAGAGVNLMVHNADLAEDAAWGHLRS